MHTVHSLPSLVHVLEERFFEVAVRSAFAPCPRNKQDRVA